MAAIDLKRRAHLTLVKPVEPSGADPIDVSHLLDRIAQTLATVGTREETRQALSLLHSWAWNEMIDETCQERARALIAEFGPSH